ncbi:class I SAM-dependent methyltransferase [Pseudomonadota bacterium]
MKTDRPQLGEYPGKELEVMSFAKNYHRWIIEEVTPFLGKTAVEVGAGMGDLSDLFLKAGVNHLYAFEPSVKLYACIQDRFKNETRVSVKNDFFNAEKSPPGINSVSYINVLEHIEDDQFELVNVYTSLGRGGFVIIFVPALPWLFSEADREMGHFRRYTKSGLIRVVEKAGFHVRKVRYFDCAGVLPWYLNFVILRNSFGARSVSLYDRLVVPPMKMLEGFVAPPFGKNVLLVAQKPRS